MLASECEYFNTPGLLVTDRNISFGNIAHDNLLNRPENALRLNRSVFVFVRFVFRMKGHPSEPNKFLFKSLYYCLRSQAPFCSMAANTIRW